MRLHALPLLSLAACAGARATTPPPSNVVATPSPVPQPGCTSDRTWDFSVSGHGLEAYEGRRVWAVALESSPPRLVRLEGSIAGGSFAFSCPHSLDTNYAYPAWAVVIDADNDGACSAGDVQVTREFYGWNFNIAVALDGKAWMPIAQAHTVVGDRASFSVCNRYFSSV